MSDDFLQPPEILTGGCMCGELMLKRPPKNIDVMLMEPWTIDGSDGAR
jgi:hypothetical protein